jgi:hypothetical protein
MIDFTQPEENTIMPFDINSLTIGQAKELAALFGNAPVPVADNSAWEIGQNYLIRTVTMIDTGRLVAVTAQELVLEDAAWIADTGRFSEAVEKAEFGEVEPFPSGRVILGRGAIIDAVMINTLPRIRK